MIAILYFASFGNRIPHMWRITIKRLPLLACATLFVLFLFGLRRLCVVNALGAKMVLVIHFLISGNACTRLRRISTERPPCLAYATLFVPFHLRYLRVVTALGAKMPPVGYLSRFDHQ